MFQPEKRSLLFHVAWTALGTIAAVAIGMGVSRMGCAGRVDDAVTGRVRTAGPVPEFDRILLVDLGPEFRPSTTFDWEKGRDAKCAQFARAVDNLVSLGAAAVAIDYHLGRRSDVPQGEKEGEAKAESGTDLTYCAPRSDTEPMYRVLKKNAAKVVVPIYLEVGAGRSIRNAAREHGPVQIVRSIPGLNFGLVNVAMTEGAVTRMPACVRGPSGGRICGLGVEAARLAAGLGQLSVGARALRFGKRTVSLWDGDLDFAAFKFKNDVPLALVALADPKAIPEPVRRRIKGAVVFVGNRNDCLCRLGDRTSGDVHRTPYGYLTGLEIHANVAATLLSGRGLRRLSGWLWVALALFLSLSAFLVGRYGPLPVSAPSSVVWMALAGVFAVWLRHGHGILIPVVGALLAPASGYVFGLAVRLRAVGIERFRLWFAFRHYLSPDVIKEVLKDPSRLRLGGHRRKVSVLFSDIRGFTAFSEKMAPDKLVHFLNEYFSAVTDILMNHRGYLDKYIGDAVMGIFGAPVEAENESDHACQACAAALEMVDSLEPLNRKWKERGHPAVAIGVGVNTGEASVGNMGSARRFNYTAMGDSVNLAARLETLNKAYGTSILVGSRTRELALSRFLFRELDLVRVVGRAEPEPVYELLCHTEGHPGTDVELYEKALEAYRKRQFEPARGFLVELLDRYPSDGPAAVLFDRMKVLERNPPPEDWDGVYTMEKK